MRRFLVVSLVFLFTAGCYHATVDTGLPDSTDQISKKWASSWIFGLVPPSTIETASECPNGVAQVDTQLSFLNQVVSAVTFGIYTPMEIVVTCAAAGRADAGGDGAMHVALDRSDDLDTQRRVLSEAVKVSHEQGRTLQVTVN